MYLAEMYTLEATNHFERKYNKLTRNNKQLKLLIEKTAQQLAYNPFAQGLRSHAVDYSEEYGKIWSSRVSGDIRILWALGKYDKLVIILIKIGGHDDID